MYAQRFKDIHLVYSIASEGRQRDIILPDFKNATKKLKGTLSKQFESKPFVPMEDKNYTNIAMSNILLETRNTTLLNCKS